MTIAGIAARPRAGGPPSVQAREGVGAGLGVDTPSRSPIRSCRRRNGFGAHQFHEPSSSISEGTSSARMIDASISTASAVPTPSSLMNTSLDVANAPIATANRTAAAVTMRPVRWRVC
jgi:hypothetical protein